MPPVIDAADVLRDPRRMLTLLCEAVGVEFTDRMLQWEPGLPTPTACGRNIGIRKWRTPPALGPIGPRTSRSPNRWAGCWRRARRTPIACTRIGSGSDRTGPGGLGLDARRWHGRLGRAGNAGTKNIVTSPRFYSSHAARHGRDARVTCECQDGAELTVRPFLPRG